MDLNVKDENGVDEKNEARRSPNKKEIDVKKKQMTLNLDSSKSASRKRAVIGNNGLGNANSITSILDPQSMSGFWNSPFSKVILESPDVQMLKMPTPDVEKFILASNLNSTPTPSLANRKFLETMKQLSELNSEPFNSQNNNSNSDSSRPPSNASNSDNNPYLQDDNSNATSLISGNNSNCSFNTSNNSANNQSFNENADLEAIGMLKNQDLSKLERKRLRNRLPLRFILLIPLGIKLLS